MKAHSWNLVFFIALSLATCREPPRSVDVVDLYTPNVKPRDLLGTARAKSRTLAFGGSSGTFSDSGIPKMDGFEWLDIRLSRPVYDVQPSDSERVRVVEVWSNKAQTPSLVGARLDKLLGPPDKTGCLVANGTSFTSAKYWKREPYAIVLDKPLNSSRWTARLTFFDSGVGIEDGTGMTLQECTQS